MRKIRTAVLAGAAALCAAGTAMAASNDNHVMRVNLPDGSVARIEYKGDIAPKVRIDPSVRVVPVHFVDPFDAVPFAGFEQVFADMDRQVAAMMQQARTLQTMPDDGSVRPDLAALRDAPPGTISYRFVSVRNGNQMCSRSWQLTSQGSGQQPKLVSASSGDCDSAAAGAEAPAKATTVSSAASKATGAGPTI